MQFELGIGLLVGGLLLILYAVYKVFYAPYQFLKSYGIKGPKPTPFFGNYREMIKMNALDCGKMLVDEYGPVVGIYIGKRPDIIIADLDILKQIMVKEFDKFSDHAPFPNILTDGEEFKDLFNLTGETWKDVRKALSPAFSTSKLKMMLPLFKRTTDNLVAVIDEKATSKQSFEVLEVYGKFTLETILATAFGRVIDLQRGESDEFSKSMESVLGEFVDGMFEKLILFHSHFPWLMRLMKYMFAYTEAGRAMAYVQRVALDLIKARRESGQAEKPKDILQLMIDANEEESDSDGEREAAEMSPPAECPAHKMTAKTTKLVMTDEEVVANSLGFLFAGNETTAITLSFVSYELALNPDIQEKLQSEIDSYFDDKPESMANLYTAAQEMAYLDSVIQETLRLHPPGIVTDRYCKETAVINGVTIPKGASITVPISVIHHSPLYWKQPEKFDPDRFTAEEKAKRHQLCHMPFGFGPRNCIGMRLALLETKIALIELLKRYTFIIAPETEVPLKVGVGISVRPKNGIHLKVVRRS